MPDELDLERGVPESSSERRRRRAESTGVGGETKTATDKLDRELSDRLDSAFGQVVEWRTARGDEELATAISEDSHKMTQGLVSLTHFVVPLRRPLLIFLAFVEPVFAFGRVGRILFSRWTYRRQLRQEELATAQAAWDAEHNAQPSPDATPFSPGAVIQ